MPTLDKKPWILLKSRLTRSYRLSPFVQRVWIALEAKGIPYQYIEIDPYAKPESLLKINPRGLVPAIQHGNWGCYESNVLLEYVSYTSKSATSTGAWR